jgi:hypothetical protein
MFPLLDLHMRDADCVGGALPPAACVLVAHSEHEGGIGGTEGGCTVRKFTTAFPNYDAAFVSAVLSGAALPALR